MALTGEQKREYQRVWIAARRAKWLEDKFCVVCGSIENLEIDHIDPKQKTRSIGTIWSLSESNPIRVNELAKCQVLCEEHHQEKTSAYRRENISHGLSAYKHLGCKCDICVEAVRKMNANRRRAPPRHSKDVIIQT